MTAAANVRLSDQAVWNAWAAEQARAAGVIQALPEVDAGRRRGSRLSAGQAQHRPGAFLKMPLC
jgi:hypothetical protein